MGLLVLGIILLVVGYVLPLGLLATIGWILVLIGLILLLLRAFRGPVYPGRGGWML